MVSNGFEFRRGRVGTVEEEEEELGSISFADEVFVNGLMKPLKLPPRMVVSLSPSPSWTPRSTTGVRNLSFRRMWAETTVSDPFQKAADKVRKEDHKLRKSRQSIRSGSGSVSPVGGFHQWTINDLNMSDDFNHIEQGSKCRALSQSEADSTTIDRIDEPRGLAIARKLRPLSMDQVQKPLSPVKESKRGLKGLLSRRKGSKIGRNGSENESNRTEIGDVKIKTLVQFRSRPKMLLCLGFQKHC